MVENTGLIAGLLAIAGAVGMFWKNIKGFIINIYSLFICQLYFENQLDVHYQLNCFACRKLKPIRTATRLIRFQDVFVNDSKNKSQVAFEIINDGCNFFWYGWVPVLIYTYKEKDEYGPRNYSIHYLRFTLDGDLFINNMINVFLNEWNNSIESDRFSVTSIYGEDKKEKNKDFLNSQKSYYDSLIFGRPVGYTFSDVSPFQKTLIDNNYYISKDVEDVLSDVRFWKENKDWYNTRGIPWKRGFVFYGRPGSGKSTCVKQIAKALNLPVYIFDILSLTNREFRENWNKIKRQTPCIALFEDFDIIFKGRENLSKNFTAESVSFDTFLNCVDGIDDADGIITCITTNNIDFLDTALSGKFGGDNGLRPGRINKVVELKALEKEGCLYICNKILPEYKEEWGDIINESLNIKETPAQFQERCIAFAVNRLYNKKGA